jgi:hypothetical protein
MSKMDKMLNENVWTTPEFNDPERWAEIERPMPDHENYHRRLQTDMSRANRQPAYLPLTDEQARHEFRRFNFYKARWMAGDAAALAKAKELRGFLVAANMMLLCAAARRYKQQYRDDQISDNIYRLFRLVEAYDWTRPETFAAYASWSLSRGLAFRARKAVEAQERREEFYEYMAGTYSYSSHDRLDQQEIVGRMLARIKDDIDLAIVKGFYGIGVPNGQTLSFKELGAMVKKDRQISKQAIEQRHAKVVRFLRETAAA